MKKILTLCAALALAAFARPASAELIYAIAQQGSQQTLITFDSSNPSNLLSANFVSGLGANETILGMDFRPSNKTLYAVTTGSAGPTPRLITIDPATGSATGVGVSNLGTFLNGVHFGFDFDPIADVAYVASDVNQNLVINPNAGALQTTGTPLHYKAGDPNFGKDPNVVDLAFDHNFVVVPNTQLWGIDTGLDVLVKSGGTNGELTTFGLFNSIDPIAVGGFDISAKSGTFFLVLQSANESVSRLYTLNPNNMVLGIGAQIDGGFVVTAMSVNPIPEPATAGLAISALLGLAALRRRTT